MNKRIVFLGLAGWISIVGLAWWLADLRIDLCGYERSCRFRATASRDSVLVVGLTVAFITGLVAAYAQTRKEDANRGNRSAVRPTRTSFASDVDAERGRKSFRLGRSNPSVALLVKLIPMVSLIGGAIYWAANPKLNSSGVAETGQNAVGSFDDIPDSKSNQYAELIPDERYQSVAETMANENVTQSSIDSQAASEAIADIIERSSDASEEVEATSSPPMP